MNAEFRQLPHSLEAEKFLLSCIFVDETDDTIAKATAAGITPRSFFDPKHGIIYGRMLDLFTRQTPINPAVVALELQTAKQLDAVGGIPFLTEVSGQIPTTAQAGTFIEVVRNAATLRETERAISEADEATRGPSANAVEIVSALRARLDRIAGEGQSSRRFPEFETEPDEREVLTTTDPIIAGLLEPGDKMSLSSGSKSFKTWNLIQLGYAIQTGTPWLGFATKGRRVLFLNFEIKPLNFWKRVFRVRRALGLNKSDTFTVWNLRGKGFSMDAHADELIRRAKKIEAGAIILDPIYKLFGERNESSAGDMASLMALFDKVAVGTGAAIIFAHHFAKGNAAAKDAMDRQSGSGVFARDPDCLVTFTRLDENECDDGFAVDVTLRDFAPVERFAVRREHPLMVRDDSLNARNLHQSGGRQAKYSAEDLAKVLPADGATVTEWRDAAKDKLGMVRSTFFDYLGPAKKLARTDGKLWFIRGGKHAA